MKPKIAFTKKTNVLNYQHNLGNVYLLRSDLIGNLDAYTSCKLNFHRHVDFLEVSSAIALNEPALYIILT
jgi:hypothetical protein